MFVFAGRMYFQSIPPSPIVLEYFTPSVPIELRVAIDSYNGIVNNIGSEGLIVTQFDFNDTVIDEIIPRDNDSSTQLFLFELVMTGLRTSGNYVVGKYDNSTIVVCCCLS